MDWIKGFMMVELMLVSMVVGVCVYGCLVKRTVHRFTGTIKEPRWQ